MCLWLPFFVAEAWRVCDTADPGNAYSAPTPDAQPHHQQPSADPGQTHLTMSRCGRALREYKFRINIRYIPKRAVRPR